jgi:hypothetical protein
MTHGIPSITPSVFASPIAKPEERKLRGLPCVLLWAVALAAPWLVIYQITTLLY